jgi:pimeloyl-[acyl-carrier protein] methyl ester esterase
LSISTFSTPPELVLLPGLEGTGRLFQPFLESWGQRSPVNVVTYPSDLPLGYDGLEDFIRKLLPDRPHFIIAESFSGPLGLRLAMAPPRGLESVVLVASFSSKPMRVPVWLAKLVRPLLARSVAPALALNWALMDNDTSDALRASVHEAFASAESAVIARRLMEVISTDLRPDIGSIEIPVAYISASRDKLVPERSYADIKAALPDLHRFGVYGPHLALQQMPEQCVAAILEFVARCGTRP